MKETMLMEPDVLKRGKMVVRALNHPLRRRILAFIHEKGRVTVTEIYKGFDIEQSVASQQLGILRREGIVLTERDRRFVFYSVNYARVNKVLKLSQELCSK